MSESEIFENWSNSIESTLKLDRLALEAYFLHELVHWHLQALNKKEHKNGVMSPDSPEPETEYQLTPRTEAKYTRIDEEFQMLIQKNQMNNGQRVGENLKIFGSRFSSNRDK